ncbi:hypothetical protein KZO58_07395 [Prevotella histicola]|uniref:hypothetical protein n=1 Tax=Prevotella histicola TaxID=470565 RepID=UPI001C5EBE62|nr:hypothetical protein [Prevotella histicola]MBW4739344.1 hypothetical protein [Prevotella histicola]MBW4747557.1 hypothetical protein [Prevotella histicola]
MNPIKVNQDKSICEHDQLKAAYALNLCTVSVSQIVGYKDLNVLEQEYELILNNLNLHNMPKDQVLLHILRQILDTVTFFRIYEGDKMMLEKKYQQKIKNAIWNAIPSFALVAFGDPYTFAMSMIASVGMGYMNYRKEKANTLTEREEQEWTLQRSAIEQFNALRRELFDTAWRLSDSYEFDDKYRLTESQISQYNSILMDSIPLRKYERLNSIKDNFEAYPPFWYYLANAAMDVVNVYKNETAFGDNISAINKYTQLAEQNYQKYLDKDIDLLRNNYIRSACDLEYAALLLDSLPRIEENEKKLRLCKINYLIDDAIKHCGSKLDILQIASIYYLKINKAEEATKHLRKLVIENYNTKTNSQLLSFIYLQETVFDTNKFIPNTLKYKELVQFTDRTNLIPWVDSEKELTKEHLRNINELFLNNQKNKLYSYFEAIVNTIFHKEIISYNKELYDRHNMVDVDDAFFEDTIDARKERDEVYKKLSSREGEWKRFTAELSKGTIIISLNKHINKLLRSLDKLVQIAFNLNIDPGKDLASIKEVLTSNHFSFKEISIDEAKSSITDNSIIQQIKYLKNKIEKNEFDFEDYLRLSFLTLTTIMEKFIEDFVMNFWTKAIAPQNAYKELVNIESNFTDFCNVEGLPSLEQLCSQGYNNRNIPEEYKIFDLFSCFEDGKNIEEQIRIEDNLTELFKSYEEKGTLFKENKDGLKFTTDTVFINNHLKTIPNNDATIIRNKGRVLAYFHDQKEWYERHIDVFFMKKGFYFRLDAKMSTSKLTFIPYNKIEFDRIKKGLKYKNEIFYQSSQINLEVLYQLIAESSSIASEFKDRKI